MTGIDFTDRALEMARERSQAAPRCGGRLRLIAVSDDPAVVQRILRHLEFLTEIPKARPTHASPTDVAPDLLFADDPA